MMDGIIRYTAEDALTQQGLQTLEGPGLWIRAADFDEHQVQVKQREVALQQSLTTADQRIDVLITALTRIHDRAEAFIDDGMHMPTPSIEVIRDIAARAALKPAEGDGDDA